MFNVSFIIYAAGKTKNEDKKITMKLDLTSENKTSLPSNFELQKGSDNGGKVTQKKGKYIFVSREIIPHITFAQTFQIILPRCSFNVLFFLQNTK